MESFRPVLHYSQWTEVGGLWESLGTFQLGGGQLAVSILSNAKGEN